jgi:hypothetical protein
MVLQFCRFLALFEGPDATAQRRPSRPWPGLRDTAQSSWPAATAASAAAGAAKVMAAARPMTTAAAE